MANPSPMLFAKEICSHFKVDPKSHLYQGVFPKQSPVSAESQSLLTRAAVNMGRHQPQPPARLSVEFPPKYFVSSLKRTLPLAPPAQALQNFLIQIPFLWRFLQCVPLKGARILKLKANCTYKRKQQGCFRQGVLSAH